MSAVPEAPLTWFLETHDGLLVLVVDGTLDEISGKVLYEGAIAQARNVHPDQAFTLIRDFARRNNRRLSEVADTIIAGLLTLPDL
ncbi:MAG TPA: ANTAR domain-containing protein [Actinoplanes sp.]|nr:ANTAR domain-containing protein [Actinoplanes sp.]